MGYRILLAVFILSIAIVLVRLVQKKQIKEKYIWLWLSLDLLAFLGASFPSVVERIAHLLGFQLASNMVLVVVVAVLVVLQLHQSVVVTRLEEDRRRIIEEIALLRYDLSDGKGTAKED